MPDNRLFSIRKEEGGYKVYVRNSGTWGDSSGLASGTIFETREKAVAWIKDRGLVVEKYDDFS